MDLNTVKTVNDGTAHTEKCGVKLNTLLSINKLSSLNLTPQETKTHFATRQETIQRQHI